MSGPPDFVGVGTHLAGTRWWHELLLEHPQIDPPAAADGALSFFETFCWREMTDADVDAYHAHFPARAGAIRGEWTPSYLHEAWTPPLLAKAAPQARLLVLVSDPIERYRLSLAYRMQDVAQTATYMTDIAHRGRYAAQLDALWAAYPREQVLVLQLERCRVDPVAQYRRTLRFLGVDDRFVPRRLRRAAAGAAGPRAVRLLRAMGLSRRIDLRWLRRLLGRPQPMRPAALWPDVALSLRSALEGEVLALRERVPDLDLRLWPNFADVAPRVPAPAPADGAAVAPRWRLGAAIALVALVAAGAVEAIGGLVDAF
jgi:hypothetical protein